MDVQCGLAVPARWRDHSEIELDPDGDVTDDQGDDVYGLRVSKWAFCRHS